MERDGPLVSLPTSLYAGADHRAGEADQRLLSVSTGHTRTDAVLWIVRVTPLRALRAGATGWLASFGVKASQVKGKTLDSRRIPIKFEEIPHWDPRKVN